MLVIHADNVNSAYRQGILMVQTMPQEDSRNGPVRVAPWPVTTVYGVPTRRVLFDAQRDANPFFHLMECLWMLSGTDNGAFLDIFVKDFTARFGEDGLHRLHGAYGKRWRRWWEVDQLDAVVHRLRKNHGDRRSVIAMWDPAYDLLCEEFWDSSWGEYREPRDLPCNTHIYPRIIQGRLDLTVCCRSNDIIWGAYGANAVHFSFLLEYLAGRIDVYPGTLYQVSNNWHAYQDVLDKVGTPSLLDDFYVGSGLPVYPIGQYWDKWDDDLKRFMEWAAQEQPGQHDSVSYANSWFRDVAVPVRWAHYLWSLGQRQIALGAVNSIGAADWQLAARRWMQRRMEK